MTVELVTVQVFNMEFVIDEFVAPTEMSCALSRVTPDKFEFAISHQVATVEFVIVEFPVTPKAAAPAILGE